MPSFPFASEAGLCLELIASTYHTAQSEIANPCTGVEDICCRFKQSRAVQAECQQLCSAARLEGQVPSLARCVYSDRAFYISYAESNVTVHKHWCTYTELSDAPLNSIAGEAKVFRKVTFCHCFQLQVKDGPKISTAYGIFDGSQRHAPASFDFAAAASLRSDISDSCGTS